MPVTAPLVSATEPFTAWLDQAQIPQARRTPATLAVLQAAFHFRQSQGDDYYSNRLLSHFLLHCDCGLKVAQLARLVGISRPTASEQQALSSKQAIQQAHHRMDGRPYGKLLPRYAGPIAQFLCQHPNASRADLADFVSATFDIHVSRIALYKFLKKFGLLRVPTPAPVPTPVAAAAAAAAAPAPATLPATPRLDPSPPAPVPLPVAATPAAPPFCSAAPSMLGPS